MRKIVTTILMGAVMLLCASKLAAQALEPGFGAPATPINVCNGSATFSVKVVGGLNACPSGTISVQLPAGFVYVAGSAAISGGTGTVSESAVSGNTANFTVTNIPKTPGFTIISYRAYASCDALANPSTANNQAVYTLNSACSPQSNSTTNSFNIKSAALSISNVTNKSYIGAVGDMYTRTITITNKGLGTVSNITLADTSGNGLFVKGISVSGGWNFLTSKTVIGTDTVSIFTLTGAELAKDQSISLIENVSLVNDCLLESRLGAWFGCDNMVCSTGNISSNSTAGATLNFSYLPELKIVPEQQDLSCRGVVYPQTIRFVNTGSAPMRDLVVNLFSTTQTSSPALQTFNAANDIQSSQSGFQGFQFKLGVNGTWSNLALSQSQTFTTPAASLSGMNSNIRFGVTQLNPGDTFYVRYNEKAPMVNSAVNDVMYTAGSVLSYSFRGRCDTRTSTVSSFVRLPQETKLTALPIFPTKLEAATNYTLSYHIPFAESDLYQQTGATASSIRFEFQLPENVLFTGNISNFNLNKGSGATLASPSLFNYNPGTRTIRATYTFSSGFSFGDLENSFLNVGQISLNCAVASSGTPLVLNAYLKNLSSCAQEELIFSRHDPLNTNCPAPICGPNGGIRFSSFTLNRRNFGLPDNNNNGAPDPSGSVDMSKVRSDLAMQGDTIVAAFGGRIQMGASSPVGGFTHGYAIDSITSQDNFFTNLYARVELFSSGSNVPFYTSNNLSVGNISSAVRKVDFSIPALQASKPLPAGYTKFVDNDSVVISIYYKISGNAGSVLNSVKFNNGLYVSDLADPAPASQYHCGNKPSGVINLVGFTQSTTGISSSIGGGTITTVIDNLLQLSPAQNDAGNKPFAFEYRPLSIYERMTYTLPAGYDFVSASLTYTYTTGINKTASKTVTILPSSTSGGLLVFDIASLFQNGTFIRGDQGSKLTGSVIIRPNCQAISTLVPRFTLRQTATGGSSLPDFTVDQTDSIYNSLPSISGTSANTQPVSIDNQVNWEVQIANASDAQALRVWMAKASGGNITITRVERLSGAGGTVLNTVTANGNGIYQLGTFGQTSVYYRINATYNSCAKESLKLYYGYDCANTGYPTSAASAVYKKELSLNVTGLQPSLQTTLVSGPSSLPTHDFCDVLTYELETVNTGMGAVKSLAVQTFLPGGTGSSYVPGSFQLQYPAGSGAFISIPDASVSVNGATVTFTIPSDEIAELFDNESFRVKFGLTTSCDFASGGSFRFNSTGQSFCGLAIGSPIQQAQMVNITGIPTSTNRYTINSSANTALLNCATGELTSTYRFKIVNLGAFATTSADGFTIDLPGPWQMNTGSANYLHNPSGSSYSGINSDGAYEFVTGAGLAIGDSVVFTVTLTVPAANVPTLSAGNSIAIVENAIIKYGGTCSSTGTPCPVTVLILSTNQTTTILYSKDPAYTFNKPVLVITSPSPVCSPATVDITQPQVTAGSTPGLTYTYFTDAAGTVALLNPTSISVSGTYYIKGTSSAGCTDIKPVTVLINPAPFATINYPGTPYCINSGATINVTRTGLAGGIYSATPAGLNINSTTGQINLASSTPGTYVVTYSFTNGTCTGTTTATITIRTLPTASISYAGSPYCINPTRTISVTQTGQAGGVYTVSPAGLVINSVTGEINTAGSVPGTYTITYSFSDGICNGTATASVTIQNVPVLVVTNPPPVCSPATVDITRPQITSGSASGLTYQYFSDAAGTIPVVNPTSVSTSGTYYIRGRAANGCYTDLQAVVVTINALPVATISYPGTPYCSNIATTLSVTQTGQTGGTYSASPSGLVVHPTTGEVNLVSSTPGTYVVTYSFSNGTCSSTASTTITINSLPTATISYAGSPYCTSPASTVNVSRTGQGGGTFSASPSGLVINSTTGAINPGASTPGTYTITYSFTNGICSNTATTSITILAPPLLVVNNPAPVCPPASVDITLPQVTAGSASGLILQYYRDAAGTIVLTNPTSVNVAGTYYIKATGATGCVTIKPVMVTINTLPTATISYSGSPYCTSNTAMVSVNRTGQSGGTFTASPAGLIINTNTGELNIANSTPGTYTITYNFTNGTCVSSASTSITIQDVPTLVVTNPAPVCAPATVDITVPSITAGSGAGLTYQYYRDPAGTIVLTNPTSISTSGTYYIRGRAANGCFSNIKAVVVTINTPPVANISYPGSPFCINSSTTVSVTRTGQGGGTYSASPAGLLINSTTGAVNIAGSTPGNYIITYSFTNGTCPGTATTSITIEDKPTLVITNPAPVCAPATVDITAAAITAGSSAGLTLQYFTNIAGTIALANPTAISVSGTYYILAISASGCSDIKPVVVTINAAPIANIGYDGSPYCISNAITVNVTRTGQGGGTYSASPAGLVINTTTGALNIAGSTPGNYTITYSFSNGTCANTATASITIQDKPTLVITNPAPVCSPATVDITGAAITAGSSAGLTLQYYTNAAGTIALSNPTSVSTSGTYYIKAVSSTGCADIKPVTVVINAAPVASISYAGSPYCTSNTTTVNVTRTGQSGGTYSASPAGLVINSSTGELNIANSTPGTYTITYSFSNGTCSNTAVTSITIQDLPTLVITNPVPVCTPVTVDITSAAITAGSSAGLTLQYYTNASGTIALANPNAIGTSGTYYIKAISATGCSVIKPVVVVINTAPTATISYAGSPYCTSNTTTVSVNRTGQSGGTYSASPAGLVIDTNTGELNIANSSAGTYTITYNFSNGTCGNTATTSVTIQNLPTLVITDPAAVCAPATVDITSAAITTGSTAGLTYQYYSDAAGTVVLTNPASISTSGTYYIRGKAANGCLSNVQAVAVTINAAPTATISYAGSPYCISNTTTVTVSRTGQGGGTYSASPAGLLINSATGAVNIAGSSPGTYTITYSITNGTCAGTATTSIAIQDKPTLVITNPAAVCSPATVDLTAAAVTTGSAAGLTYKYYSNAAGTNVLSNPDAVSVSGTYYIRGIAANGCESSLEAVTVNINSLPEATISYAGPFCIANTTTATVTQTGQTGGVYSAPAGLKINASTGALNISGSTPGTYTVTYSFSNGTCSNTATTEVTIEGIPVLVVVNPAAVCAPNTVDLTAATVTTGSTSGLSFRYYSDAGGTTVLDKPAAVKISGTYYIRGYLAAGCQTDLKAVKVAINDLPKITVSNDTIICKNGTATLLANSPGNTITWKNLPSGNPVTVSPSGTTTYTAIATSPQGCTSEASAKVQIRSFDIQLNADNTNVPIGSTVLLTTLSNQSYSVIAWLPQQSLPNQTATTQSFVMNDSAKYFSVVAKSVEGCIDTASIWIKINHDLKDFFIPNAITPNQDGHNDVFRVYGTSVKAVEIRVYNSWGELLLFTTDNQKGWDGTFKGKAQPSGVYVYTVRAVMYNNAVITRKGTINLIR
ncbi:gliding motility-associated C-terminal domain-containing protein [Pollutibacter soli]|uniref:Ig-like domain-containing protein n=1 Tax=Pollutibacter soli TaxID=3034157 RepID=UPI003013444A